MPRPTPEADRNRPASGDSFSAQPDDLHASSPFHIDESDIPGEGMEDPYEESFPFDEDMAQSYDQTWIVIGDVHSHIDNLERIPGITEADGVIVTGDITRLGGVAAARSVIEAIQALNPVVMAQIGNMDGPEVNEWLESEGINLHCKVRELSADVAIMGVGGSTFTPFGTPSEFPEARFAEWLESLAKRAAGYRSIIVVSHNPPHDTACDRLAGGGHAGSQALREFLEEHQPSLCLCGHIHEAYGQQLLGRTMVVNPGAFAAGGYIVLRLGEDISVNLYRLGSLTD